MINRWLKRWFKTCNYPKASQKIEAKSDKNEKWQWKSKCLLGKRALRLVPQPFKFSNFKFFAWFSVFHSYLIILEDKYEISPNQYMRQ